MPRRVNLPAADDLFRPTSPPAETSGTESPARRAGRTAARPQSAPTEGKPKARTTRSTAANAPVRAVPDAPDESKKGASGRIRHDEKMTVYVTAQELLDIERTRLELRGTHGLGIDRGRLVREALDLVLADFDENGEDSLLVRRLLEG
ncbi:hypothetical protein [Nocardioides sp. R-C-SC26]|uniref:hypothetical protein n=1 Tax=Nocardioides sp. R-C-SC26 TaxID=2870414 RepID=UPI001E29E467|nr:hypothetical protein [Nocardioides sp. R-C-SC26]